MDCSHFSNVPAFIATFASTKIEHCGIFDIVPSLLGVLVCGMYQYTPREKLALSKRVKDCSSILSPSIDASTDSEDRLLNASSYGARTVCTSSHEGVDTLIMSTSLRMAKL